MAVLDQFFIKVNDDNMYDSNGTFKCLRDIHSHNDKLFPQNSLDNYAHPVIKEFGSEPNAYKQIYSSDTSKFVNTEEEIDFLFDSLNDAMTPIVSERLYKAGVDYPIMHPYMVAVLDSFAKENQSRVALDDGDYYVNKFGGIGNPLKSAGVIEIQAPGGGSGGTNNTDADCAGAGGGSGAFAAIYYRIKNTDAQVKINVYKGDPGEAGGAGSGHGGDATAASVGFMVNDDLALQYSVAAEGGHGGQTGNYNYTSGGTGGKILFLNSDTGSVTTIVNGGQGGTESLSPLSGDVATPQVLLNNDYLFIYLLAAQGGAGGGRGDDTDGSALGQAGASSIAMTYNFPTSHSKTTTVSFPENSGGTKGSNVNDAQAGGGGASVFAKGGNGGATSTTGNPGTLGSGAGGAGCGNNANRKGSKGGDGIIYYYN